MDKTRVMALVDFLVGDRIVGVDADGTEIGTPVCPEARAFVVGQLGDLTPVNGWQCLTDNTPLGRNRAQAMAHLLRDAAEFIEKTRRESQP